MTTKKLLYYTLSDCKMLVIPIYFKCYKLDLKNNTNDFLLLFFIFVSLYGYIF